ANLLSLGAIDFGIIVDGAVIMVENIVRRLSHLKTASHPPSDHQIISSIVASTKEVAKPILFSTAIIVMTFLPILSFEHVEGRLSRPLAIMMFFNLFGAVLATMTVIPVLCILIFRHRPPTERVSPVINTIEKTYKPLLKWSVRNRLAVAGVALTTLLL